jgi:hypothetical protein
MIGLLESRHSRDVFVAECKDGPSQARSHRRLDAWVLRRTWSPITMIGYEIKESRADFLRDEKWPDYLPLCHQFYFACPSGLIQPDELPKGVGLVWASKNGKRLFNKKRALRCEIEIPSDLLVYVIMSRARITLPGLGEVATAADFWRDWLKTKAENRQLGWNVRRALGEETRKIERRNDELEKRYAEYDKIRARLKELGFDESQVVADWQVQSRIEDIGAALPARLEYNLRQHARQLNAAADKVAEIRGEG